MKRASDRHPGGLGLHRVLSRLDVLLLCLVSTVNLNLLPAAAANGPSVFGLWALVVILFVIPQGLAVVEMAECPEAEQGIATWVGHHLGDFAGFLTAWCYWANNLFYVPTLVVFVVGNIAFLAEPLAGPVPESRPLLLAGSMVCLWAVVGMCLIGLRISRWISNLGGACVLLVLVGLVSMGLWVGISRGFEWPSSARGSGGTGRSYRASGCFA